MSGYELRIGEQEDGRGVGIGVGVGGEKGVLPPLDTTLNNESANATLRGTGPAVFD